MSQFPSLSPRNQGLAALRHRMDSPHELGFLVSAGSEADKNRLLTSLMRLSKVPGIRLYATEGTSRFLTRSGVANERVYRISEGIEPNFESLIETKRVGMIINIPTGDAAYDEQSDNQQIRRLAARKLIALLTDADVAIHTIDGLLAPPPHADGTRSPETTDIWSELITRIEAYGGMVNAHAHADKAYTAFMTDLALGQARMREKWEIMRDIKLGSRYSPEGLRERIGRCAREMVEQRVVRYRTFVDVDSIVNLKTVDAALAVKAEYEDRLLMEVGTQPLEGLMDPASRRMFEAAAERVDFIGGLPSRDGARSEEHLDIVMELAKKHGIGVDVHVDQANDPAESESEQLARATMRHGLEGRVTAVHSISLAAKPKEERKRVIALMKDAGLTVVVCPSAALSMQQLDHISAPTHNSIAPVVELMEAGIPVLLGCDNVQDIFMPMSRGNMLAELLMLAEAARFYDPEVLAKVAAGKL
jgi:cytosine/creatinine deaminase